MRTLEYGKIKGLDGLVCVIKSKDKIEAVRMFLCGKMSPAFMIKHLKKIGVEFDSAVKKDLNYVAEHMKDVRRIKWEKLGLKKLTPFQKKVYKELFGSKAGDIYTYSELAKKASKPKAARAVGSLMSGNSLPLLIPCHRVTSKSGKESFFIPCFIDKPSCCKEKNISKCAERIKNMLRSFEIGE